MLFMKLRLLIKKLFLEVQRSTFFIGLLSLVWFIFRTGTKPSRAVYPCQKAAATNSYIWFAAIVLPTLGMIPRKISASLDNKKATIIILVLIIVASVGSWSLYEMWRKPQSQATGLTLVERVATSQPSSDIFVVNGTDGNGNGIVGLMNLMSDHGLLFYRSPITGRTKGSTGIIARDDVVLIKINSQWDQRGGTNTDLLKSLIQAILDHPDGFVGEIVVADNGQGQYGSSDTGGSLNWARNNAENTSQSVQKVVDSFADSQKVSAYLWDTITTKSVAEYYEGDLQDGYVVNATVNPRTGMMISYPKFKTQFGTYLSFKRGIWNPQTQTYNSERLKVINIPVLKSHGTYGVTASVKHYMGVVSDKLMANLGARPHDMVGRGGMGTEMVETRFPALNILDAIWVNAVPGAGPSTPYQTAIKVNIIAASTDPVALDYWAAKYILLQAAQIRGYTGISAIDPDNVASAAFGSWLRLTMNEIKRAGYQATVEEAYMNVFLLHLTV